MARRKAMRVCACTGCPDHVGSCPAFVRGGRCADCARQADRARGTRQERGYDAEHERLRRWWKPKVEAGTVHCHAEVCVMPARFITPGTEWHLDHNDDRTGYRGPAHALCNTSAGGKAAHH